MHSQLFFRFLIIFFMLPMSIWAQRKQGQARLDSLLSEIPKMQEDSNGVKLMDAIGYFYATINPDEGLKWAEKELALAQKISWKKGQAWAYNVLGTNRQSKGEFPVALGNYFKSLQIYEEIGDTKGVVTLANGIGHVYFFQGNYNEALKWFFKSLKLAEEIGNKRTVVLSLGSIAMAYVKMGKNDTAIKYQLKALPIAQQFGDESLLAQVMGNTALTYMNTNDFNHALAYTFQALHLAQKIGDKQLVANQLANAGISYWLIVQTGAPIRPDSLVAATSSANLTKAIKYLQDALAASKDAQYLQAIPDITQALSSSLEIKGDYKGALAAFKEYTTAKDSIFSMANNEKIADLETQRALQLKDKDIEIAKLAVEKKRNERAFFMAGIALLLAIMGIIIYNFRRHERNRRHIKALQDYKISLLDEAVKRRTEQLGSMRQTIATDFHDQTGNMLAAITRQAATLELKLLQQPEVLPLVRTIINNSNELYASSKDFLWNLNHDSDDPLVLFQYLSGYGQRFYNQFDISFSSLIKGDGQPHMQLHPFAGLNLIYIFKEAMSNVIKHSGADEVSIELCSEADQVTYTLQDNGTWKEADSSIEHYGLGNMERRCKQSGFGYKLSHDAAGTRVAVTLPMTIGFVNTPDPSLPFNP